MLVTNYAVRWNTYDAGPQLVTLDAGCDPEGHLYGTLRSGRLAALALVAA